MAYRVMTPSTFHIEAAEAADEQSIHEAMGLPFETEAEAFCSSLKPENSPREKAENVSKKRRRRHKSSATREVNFREGKERGAEENVAMQADLTQGDCMNRNFEDNFEFNEGDSEEVLEREKQLSEVHFLYFFNGVYEVFSFLSIFNVLLSLLLLCGQSCLPKLLSIIFPSTKKQL